MTKAVRVALCMFALRLVDEPCSQVRHIKKIVYCCRSDIHKCMVNNEPGWDLYRSFLAVLRLGSLSAAGRALGLTQPTIGRHIAMLQANLGGRVLFTRSQSGLMPTAAAHELRPHAEDMAAAAAAFVRT